MQAAVAGQRRIFEQAVHLVQGRCSRVAHIVSAEMRENPARYPREKREGIGHKVHKMKRKCKAVCWHRIVMICLIFSSEGVSWCCIEG